MDHVVKIREALNKNESIVIACSCSVRYSGRAESHLPAGDRIVIIKSDNTILVHQPTGSTPVNYMKSDTAIDVREDGGSLVLNGRASKEYIDIAIDKVYSLTSHKLEDGASLVLNGSEKDMSDMIFANPQLIERGFRPLNREEHTKHGFIDVFGFDRDNTLTVVECKRYAGDPKAVDQLRRYVERVRQSHGVREVRGILACPRVSPKAKRMLQDYGFSHVRVEPPKYLERYGKNQKSLSHFTS
jgi:RecB family endonuclease NucS